MKKLLVLALATATLALGGPVWAAGPPYTVSVGGSSAAASHPVTGSSTGLLRFTIKNNAGTTLPLTCTSVSVTGSVTSGVGVNPWASVTSSTWSGCIFIGGAYSVTQATAWPLVGTGTNATPSVETIAGRADNVDLAVASAANPAICSFRIRGTTSTSAGSFIGAFDESTQTWSVSPTGFTAPLRTWNVSGCLGQVQNGNPVDLAATLPLASPNGAVNLS